VHVGCGMWRGHLCWKQLAFRLDYACHEPTHFVMLDLASRPLFVITGYSVPPKGHSTNCAPAHYHLQDFYSLYVAHKLDGRVSARQPH